jgi:hypothetical protein
MVRLLVPVVLAGLLVSCGGPRAMTDAEAERLAQVRVTGKVSAFDGRVPSGAGRLVLVGQVDFSARVGEATMTVEGREDLTALRWDLTQLAVRQEGAWQYRALQRAGGELDAALLLLVNLGGDRPDNPADLQRSVRWARSDTVGEIQVDVFEGDRLTYWVDAEGNLVRLHARLGDHPEPAAFDFRPAAWSRRSFTSRNTPGIAPSTSMAARGRCRSRGARGK